MHVFMIGVRENDISSEMIADSRKSILARASSLPAHRHGHGKAPCEYDERSRKQREMHASICLRLFTIGHPKQTIAFLCNIPRHRLAAMPMTMDADLMPRRQ
jgi:hypothetical protein